MNKLNQFPLKLKLKTNKLSSFDLEDCSLEIDGSQKVASQFIVSVVLPIIFAIIMFVIYYLIVKITGVSINWMLAFGMVAIIITVILIVVLQRKIANNRKSKIIGRSSVHLNAYEVDKILLIKNDVKQASTDLAETNREVFEGMLLNEGKNSKKHLLLSIFDSDKRFLKEELDYFKRFL